MHHRARPGVETRRASCGPAVVDVDVARRHDDGPSVVVLAVMRTLAAVVRFAVWSPPATLGRMVVGSSSESSPRRDGTLSILLAERCGRARDSRNRNRNRNVFDNGGVDAVAPHDETPVDGTTPAVPIANDELHAFGVANDTGAAAKALAIDVETAPLPDNSATKRIVRIIRCAIAAGSAEARLRAPIEPAPTIATTQHAERLRSSGETRTTDLRATAKGGLRRRSGRGLERARRGMRRHHFGRVQAAPERRLGE